MRFLLLREVGHGEDKSSRIVLHVRSPALGRVAHRRPTRIDDHSAHPVNVKGARPVFLPTGDTSGAQALVHFARELAPFYEIFV